MNGNYAMTQLLQYCIPLGTGARGEQRLRSCTINTQQNKASTSYKVGCCELLQVVCVMATDVHAEIQSVEANHILGGPDARASTPITY